MNQFAYDVCACGQPKRKQALRCRACYTSAYTKPARDTTICKIEGCSEPPIQQRGAYAGLCSAHRPATEARPRPKAVKPPAVAAVDPFYRDQELPFHHPQRIRQNVAAVISDPDNRFFAKKLFSVALHAEYLLQVMERHGLMHLVIAEQAQRQQEAA